MNGKIITLIDIYTRIVSIGTINGKIITLMNVAALRVDLNNTHFSIAAAA